MNITNITQKLLAIQLELKAPKNQRNKFGNYNYRSAEDILEAIKPYTKKHNVLFKITEEIKMVGEHVFIESVAKCIDVDSQEAIESVGTAIVDFQAKGMQMPQRTGAASSYAKKYALGNLLLLDDTKDADSTNTHGKSTSKTSNVKSTVTTTKKTLESNSEVYNRVVSALRSGKYTIEDFHQRFNISVATLDQIKQDLALSASPNPKKN